MARIHREDTENSFYWKFLNFIPPSLIQEGGYHLVKPVLDQYGKSGIEYLIRHTPRALDLLDLPSYQKKALEELVRGK